MDVNIAIKLLVKSMIKKYPNDYDLGLNFRKDKLMFSDFIDETLFRKYPNDYDLGKVVRKTYTTI